MPRTFPVCPLRLGSCSSGLIADTLLTFPFYLLGSWSISVKAPQDVNVKKTDYFHCVTFSMKGDPGHCSKGLTAV